MAQNSQDKKIRRDAKLAKALRANLKRRKAQTRSRVATAEEDKLAAEAEDDKAADLATDETAINEDGEIK